MAADKAVSLAATGARVLVSQDCGCLMNLGGTLARKGERLEVRHLAAFLWERTGGE
jgi:L-lactate dehydrogenase complex protein LldE